MTTIRKSVKMEAIAKVILSTENGSGPDILILQEVENRAVLESLRTKYLAKAQYLPPVIIEGEDYRGIDVAMLSRFALVGSKLHDIEFKEAKLKYGGKTRPILEGKFKLPSGEVLAAFGVHFPSPAHHHKTRVEAFEELKTIMKATKANVILAAGDFNVKAGEGTRIYNRLASPRFDVSHLVGCRKCLGTNYFKPQDSWSFLDAIMVDKNSSWSILPKSVRVVQHSSHVTKKSRPMRFNEKSGQGVSDHFPIYLQLGKK